MESPEKNSETERSRSRKTKRKQKRKTNANAKPLVLGSDSYSYSYSEHEAETCRRELDYRYHQDLRKSDGFDVDMYKIPIPEQITPCDLDIYSNVAIKFGKFAVDDFNQKQPEGGIKLAFVKPLKCNIRHSRGITYYITFEAKYLDAPDDQSLTYQTQVFYGFKTKPQVKVFRPKLTDKSEITSRPRKKKKAKTQSYCVHDFESYYRELEPREGYDISPGNHDCMIKPMKLNAENTQLATKLGQCALESYYRQKKNKQIWEEKGPVVKLKFVQPLKMNSENMKDGSIRYYLTFLAKVVGVPDDQSPISYQTQVSVYDGVVRVARFRPKLTANSNSSGVSLFL